MAGASSSREPAGSSAVTSVRPSADHLVASFVAAYGLDAVTIRPFNTYGPGQSTRAVLPTIITQALSGGAIRLGSVDSRRDMTYVDDTVRGLMAAIDAPAAAGQRDLGVAQ